MFTKVTYTVSANGMTLLPQMLPQLNNSRLQEVLRSISPNRQYSLVTQNSQITEYDKLFWLYLQQPVFTTDIGIFEHYLEVVWQAKKGNAMNVIDFVTTVKYF